MEDPVTGVGNSPIHTALATQNTKNAHYRLEFESKGKRVYANVLDGSEQVMNVNLGRQSKLGLENDDIARMNSIFRQMHPQDYSPLFQDLYEAVKTLEGTSAHHMSDPLVAALMAKAADGPNAAVRAEALEKRARGNARAAEIFGHTGIPTVIGLGLRSLKSFSKGAKWLATKVVPRISGALRGTLTALHVLAGFIDVFLFTRGIKHGADTVTLGVHLSRAVCSWGALAWAPLGLVALGITAFKLGWDIHQGRKASDELTEARQEVREVLRDMVVSLKDMLGDRK